MERQIRVIVVLTLAILFSSCGNDQETEHIDASVAMDTIHNLVPFDSIGVEAGDNRYMLGDIWAASYTPDGSIAILDRTLGGVRFYSADGVHLLDFIPSGEGPGEFTSVDCMCFDTNGNLMLGSYYDRKVALYSPYLNFIKEILYSTARLGPVRMAPGVDSSFVLLNYVMKDDSVGSEIVLFRDEDQPVVVYRNRMVLYTPDVNYQAQTGMVLATSTDGRIYIADKVIDRFWITCYSHQGDSLFSFGFEDFEPVAKPDSLIEYQKNRALDSYVSYYGTSEGFIFDPIRSYYLPIQSIAVDGEGRIWVRGEENSYEAYVFSPNGRHLHTCQGLFPDWQESDGFNIRINSLGILADPRNPEQFPVVYRMREDTVIVPR